VRDLCETVLHKNNRISFTAQQREGIASRLKAVFSTNLPDQNNIKHEGYLIVCVGCELALRDNAPFADWTALIDRGRAIPNAADRAFVLYELAELLPTKYSSLRSEVRGEALQTILLIPSAIDRVNRLIGLTAEGSPESSGQAKTALRSAMVMTFAAGDTNLAREKRKEIIDMAEKLGEDFANELAELIDEDPARAHAREEVRSQLKQHHVNRKLANAVEGAEELSIEDELHLQRAAWTSLGRLMSGRLECKMPEATAGFVRKSSAQPVESAYPVLSWHIENLGRKYVNTAGAESPLRAVVEQLLTSTELAVSLIGRAADRRNDNWLTHDRAQTTSVIGISNRKEALDFIGKWLEGCRGQIVLCDPYFGPDDVPFLAQVLASSPTCNVVVLSSKRELLNKDALGDEKFIEVWRSMRDQDPPPTRVLATSHGDKLKSALHDRWIVCGDRGLSLGTSYSSIGTGKLTAVSQVDPEQVIGVARELNRFVNEETSIDGVKIGYVSFKLQL
jgi:hypothetical protein